MSGRASWILALAAACACGDGQPEEQLGPRVRGEGEPRRVLIERILISYRGNSFDIPARRSLEEARLLAERIHARARSGEDFVDLRDGYSDDRRPGSAKANGPYVLMNYDVPIANTMPHVARMERMGMGRRLGDTAFRMQEGEVALVEHHPEHYAAGFEVIRCLRRDDRTEEQVAEDLKKPRAPRDEGN